MTAANDPTIPVCAAWIGPWKISLRCRPLAVPEVVKRYDRLAPRWSRLTDRLGYPRAYRRLFEQFLGHTELGLGTQPIRVLDCGVGTGTFALAFAEAWDAPVQMDAVDVSGVMIGIARQRLRQGGVNAAIERADLRELPYAENQFDLVIAAHVLEHLSDPIVALKEMRRVTKPGGWVLACMTRKSPLGRFIQLKWRTHRLTQQLSESWFSRAALQPCHLDVSPSGFFRLMSLTCIGRKPI